MTPIPSSRLLQQGRRAACAAALLALLGGAPLAPVSPWLGVAPAAAQLAGVPPAGAPESFADLATAHSGAVVNISTRQNVSRSAFDRAPEFPPGSPFEEFFKEYFGEGGRPSTVTSLGSGFVIDAEGYIVTNNHVIESADEVTVNFPNGDSAAAEIVGRDPKTDLALLKLIDTPAEPLAVVDFGDSDSLRVGDWVMAIGNPFGLGGSVSAGIVSARGRSIDVGPYDDFIQTDAAINRGNSGGPLFNLRGEVIGVNTAIYSPTGGWVGIGFATPSNIAREVVDQLREHGVTRRGWIGVRSSNLGPEKARELGLPRGRGAVVSALTEDAPAAKAGLQEGDVILKFDGHEVADSRALTRIVAGAEIDAPADVAVNRAGEELILPVTVGLLEEEAPEIRRRDSIETETLPGQAPGDSMVLGMALGALTPEIREERGLPDELQGALIVDVASTGAAAQKGLRVGDLVVEIANAPVASPEEAAARIADLREQGRSSALFLIRRGEDLRFVSLRLTVDAP